MDDPAITRIERTGHDKPIAKVSPRFSTNDNKKGLSISEFKKVRFVE